MDDCVFCKIVKGKIPASVVKETEDLLVFKDINPKAPIHLLIIPKKHYPDLTKMPDNLWSEARKVAISLARERKLTGFRFGTNAGDAAIISHAHIHFLGGITKEREI